MNSINWITYNENFNNIDTIIDYINNNTNKNITGLNLSDVSKKYKYNKNNFNIINLIILKLTHKYQNIDLSYNNLE